MRLKEIKPGMIIHCKNDEEKKALLEEAERLGYRWNTGEKPTDRNVSYGSTIHFEGDRLDETSKFITWTNHTENVTEFSDLIIPELTAEEVVQWFREYYFNTSVMEYVFGDDCTMAELLEKYTSKEICDYIFAWKAGHEKKEPEIETVDICRIIEVFPNGSKRCVHEEDIKKPITLEVEETLKRYCMEHEGEFIAVHEVVSRVKR